MSKDVSADYSAYGFLVADDKAFIRNMIQSMLMRCRARMVTHAANGEEAMKMLLSGTAGAGRIDCVLCDWNMTPGDGLSVLRAVRAGAIRNVSRDVRFIMLTAHAEEEIVNTAVAMDTHGYLVKPVSFDSLIKAVNHALSRQITLKEPRHYLDFEAVPLPHDIDGPVHRMKPWVLKSEMRPHDEDKVISSIESIREEVESQKRSAQIHAQKVVNKHPVIIAEIKVGSVLGQDVRDDQGRLLLVEGTRLTEMLLDRLRFLSAADPSAVLLVGELEKGAPD